MRVNKFYVSERQNIKNYFAKSETDNLGVVRRRKQEHAGNGANYDNYLPYEPSICDL